MSQTSSNNNTKPLRAITPDRERDSELTETLPGQLLRPMDLPISCLCGIFVGDLEHLSLKVGVKLMVGNSVLLRHPPDGSMLGGVCQRR